MWNHKNVLEKDTGIVAMRGGAWGGGTWRNVVKRPKLISTRDITYYMTIANTAV